MAKLVKLICVVSLQIDLLRKQILQQFIVTNGFSSVDIKRKTRDAIIQACEGGVTATTLFLAAQQEILEQLEREIFPAYVKSAHYRAWACDSTQRGYTPAYSDN